MHRILLLVLTVAVAGNEPIPVTPLPGYPCGTTWHECGNGACCQNAKVCGAAHTGCPVGACCYVGDDGATRFSAQRKAPAAPR